MIRNFIMASIAFPLIAASCSDEPNPNVNIPAKLIREIQLFPRTSSMVNVKIYKAKYDNLNRPTKITISDDWIGTYYSTDIDYKQGTIISGYIGKEPEAILRFELDNYGRISKIIDTTHRSHSFERISIYTYNADGYLSEFFEYGSPDYNIKDILKTTYTYNGNVVSTINEIGGKFDSKDIFTFSDQDDRSSVVIPSRLFYFSPLPEDQTYLFLYWCGMLGRRIKKICTSDESTISYIDNGNSEIITYIDNLSYQLKSDNDGYITYIADHYNYVKWKIKYIQ